VKRVAGYVRVSRVAGRNGDSFQSPDAQADAIHPHCKARRLKVIEVARELDQSGGTMQRPHLRRLIDDIKAGKLDGIIVHRLDRFARTLVGGIQTLEEIHAAGGFVQTVEGGIDTSETGGAMGELQLNLLLTLAQWERAVRAEGFEAAKARAVARGVHISGTVPVGYQRPEVGSRLELDPVKAPAIHDAFELRAGGAALGDVARFLNERLPGGPSGDGVWNRATVTRLLGNPVYVGEARQGVHRLPGAHPPIVTQEVFDTVAALKRRAEPSRNGRRIVSLLAGVVRCGSCGYAMDRNRVGGNYLVYRCAKRGARHVCEAPTSAMAPALESLVTGAVLDNLERLEARQVPVDVDVDQLHARLAAARLKRLPFEDADYVGLLGVAAAGRALAKVDDEIARLEDELAQAIGTQTVADEPRLPAVQVRELWPTLAIDEQREVILGAVEAVTVSRGTSRAVPLADRVVIYWTGDALPFVLPTPGRPRRRRDDEVEAGIPSA
jgi:DNA invertase Pin-like site-specific DNA recombinase